MADFIYGLPEDKPTPIPRALQLGLDWQKFHTPPYAGGLFDQPISLMRDIRNAVNVYNAISSWNKAQHFSAEAQAKYYAANQQTVKFMEYVWKLQGISDNGE